MKSDFFEFYEKVQKAENPPLVEPTTEHEVGPDVEYEVVPDVTPPPVDYNARLAALEESIDKLTDLLSNKE